jgi:hypothetical protein
VNRIRSFVQKKKGFFFGGRNELLVLFEKLKAKQSVLSALSLLAQPLLWPHTVGSLKANRIPRKIIQCRPIFRGTPYEYLYFPFMRSITTFGALGTILQGRKVDADTRLQLLSWALRVSM